jgi:hypothetical protein
VSAETLPCFALVPAAVWLASLAALAAVLLAARVLRPTHRA